MRIVLVVAMLLVLTGLFVNAGRQIYLWLMLVFRGISQPIYRVIFGFLVLAVLAAFVVSRIPGVGIHRLVFRFGHYALGILCYVVMAANLASILMYAGRLIRLIPSPVPDSVSLAAAAVSLFLVVGFTVYGTVHAADIQIRRYTVGLGQEQDGEDTLRIALLSDIHLGYVIEEKHLAKVVAEVNALKPDIICIAGDIFDGDMTSLSNPGRLQALLGSMEAKYGVYACLGNHDAGASYQQMISFLDGTGIRVLMDESVVIGQRLVLAGRRDSSPIGRQGDSRKALEGLPEAAILPVIVLDHQPGNIGEYGSDVDLILCGHTHQGQMFPFNLITNAVFDVDYGYYRAGETAPQVIVTSGAGTWGPPFRVATDNEIVELTVTLDSNGDGILLEEEAGKEIADGTASTFPASRRSS